MKFELNSELVEELRRAPTSDLKVLENYLDHALSDREREPDAIPDGKKGTAKDTAVQKLAAIALTDLKKVKEFSYREIGEKVGVSAERIRQLYERLCPLDYGTDRIPRAQDG